MKKAVTAVRSKFSEIFLSSEDNLIKSIVVMIIGGTIYSLGALMFLENAALYTGGLFGIAQLITSLLKEYVNESVSLTIVYLICNIPVFTLGFLKLGKRFTLLSLISVVLILGFSQVSEFPLITDDVLMNSIFGGVFVGVGVGLCLRVGASTGGMDFVANYLAIYRGISFGTIAFIIDGFIVGITSAIYGAETGMYTAINIFITVVVIDRIYTRHRKLQLTIITAKPDEVVDMLHKNLMRGITKMRAVGAYSKTERTMLYMVITSSELYKIKQIIAEADSEAFCNLAKSEGVFGLFHDPLKKPKKVPREKIENQRQALNSDFGEEIKAEIIEEYKEELHDEIVKEIAEEIREEVTTEIREEVTTEIREGIIEEVAEEFEKIKKARSKVALRGKRNEIKRKRK